MLGLSWNDVDLDRSELTIGRQLQRVRGQLLHRETKTEGSDAALPLPAIVVAALRLRKAQQDDAAAKAGKTWRKSDLIFTTRFGTPIEPRNFSRSYDNRSSKRRVAGSPCATLGATAARS